MTSVSSPRASFEAVLAGARLQVLLGSRHAMTYAAGILNAVLYLGVLAVPRPEARSGPAATTLVAGVALAAFWSSCVWGGVAVLRRERWMGVLGRSIASVPDPLLVLLGKLFGAAVLNVAVVVAGIGVGCLAFGIEPSGWSAPILALGLAATVASGLCASLLVGGLLVVSRHGVAISNGIGVPVALLGGTVLPLDHLPTVVRPISRLISLSWIHDFIASAAGPAIDWGALLAAVVLSAAYGAVGVVVFGRMVDRARGEGTLELV